MERLTKGMSKTEIEKELSKWGKYVQIDNLTRFLKINPDLPTEIKKFLYQKLGEIYEKSGMFFESARSYEKSTEFCIQSSEQKMNYLKAVENYIKADNFNRAESIIRELMRKSKASERTELTKYLKETYKQEIERNTKEKRRSSIIKIYERILETDFFSEQEKKETKEKLLQLYSTLGMMGNYTRLKNTTVTRPKREAQKEESEEEVKGLEFLYR